MGIKDGKFLGGVVLKLLFFIAAFLFALQLIITAFQLLSSDILSQIIVATSNPFISLFIGLLLTAMVQSSSTTTTLIVAVVASGTISLEHAVYMVMGANIGTTVTSTIVSLGHVTRKKEFRRAIAAATLHDFFNILTTIILLPLEYYFGFLSQSARYLSTRLFAESSGSFLGLDNPLRLILSQGITWIKDYVLLGNGLLTLLAGMVILFFAIKSIAHLFKQLIINKAPSLLERALFGDTIKSFFSGIAITALVQSSSVVSSLIVPLAASNKLSLRSLFPFLMGTNLGTTITALVAAFTESQAALSIALCHILFNLFGVMVFLPLTRLREIPIEMARRLGKATLNNRLVGFVYVMLTFFIVPFFLIYSTKGSISIKEYELNSAANYQEQAQTVNLLNTSSNEGKHKAYYKQVNIEAKWVNVLKLGDHLNKEISENQVLVNQQIYPLLEIGDCKTLVDKFGKYELCTEQILQNYYLNEQLQFDVCYVFRKQYHRGAVSEYFYKIYLAPKEKIILKYEVCDQKGVVQGREELISILN